MKEIKFCFRREDIPEGAILVRSETQLNIMRVPESRTPKEIIPGGTTFYYEIETHEEKTSMKELKKIREGDSIPANARFLYSEEVPDPKLGAKGKTIKYNWLEIERPELVPPDEIDKEVKINMRK